MRSIYVIVTLLLSSFAPHAFAASGVNKGQVEFIRTHDGSVTPGWNAPRFWFTLKGVTNAGACASWVGGRILFVGNDKQMLALVISAQATGQEIAVYWDDTVLSSGYCTAFFVTIGNPAPAY